MPIINLVYEAPDKRIYQYDFKNKSTSQINNDGWIITQGTPSFNSYGIRNSGSDRMLKIVNTVQGLSDKIITCRKLIIEFTRYTTGEAAFAGNLLHYSGGTSSNGTGLYQDNRLGEWNISGGGSNIMSLSGTISGTVKFRVEYDLVNKTVAVSWNGGTKTTGTLTDEIITNIRSNTDSVYVYFWGNPNTSNLGGISDISITIQS